MVTKTLVVSLMLAAGALAVPVHAVASNTLVNFDGVRALPEKDPVRAGSINDLRAPEQIAKDEQVKADARAEKTAATPEARTIVASSAPSPSEKLKRERIIGGVMGAVCGLLGGGLLAYGLSRLTA